jgi:cell division transport system permease protein
MNSFEKYKKRRLRLSSLSVIVSIALILFLLGVLGLLVLQSKNISNNFKEKFEINVFLNNKANKRDIAKLQKYLEEKEYTKSVNFVSKIDAYNNYLKDVGEDFMEELDENPLKNGFSLYLKAAHFNVEKLSEIENEISKNKFVDDVSYSKATVSSFSDLIKKISFWLLSFSALLGLIAIVLINGYLRLSVYAKRFNIKTMQMVGATKSFIRKPFLYRSIKLGMFGALLAILILAVLLFYFNEKYNHLELLKDKTYLVLLSLGILALGILIAWLSTYFATKRFLKLKTDELYY